MRLALWLHRQYSTNMTSPKKRPPAIPKKYAGKWIAWSQRGTRIVASGRTFAVTRQAARDKGEVQPVFEKVPPGLFAGGQ